MALTHIMGINVIVDLALLMQTEDKYIRLLSEQILNRRAAGDFGEAQRLENLQLEHARFKLEMKVEAFDPYIRNAYQREREIKEGREREMRRGTMARPGSSQTPWAGQSQNVWQGVPASRDVNGSASIANMGGYGVGWGGPTLAAAVKPTSDVSKNGPSVAGSPHSDRQLNPEAKAFQPGPSLPALVAAPEEASRQSSKQPSATQATPEDIPSKVGVKKDSGYGSSSVSPTDTRSAISQEIPVATWVREIRDIFVEEQQQPAAAQKIQITSRPRFMSELGFGPLDDIPIEPGWMPRILRERRAERFGRLLRESEEWHDRLEEVRRVDECCH